MTPDEINRAIAEWCGETGQALVSDYYHDRNLAIGAVSLVRAHSEYVRNLQRCTGEHASVYHLVIAPPSALTEALLRTVGRWREDEL